MSKSEEVMERLIKAPMNTELKEYLRDYLNKQNELLELYRECYDEGYFWLEIQQRIKAIEEEIK